jgi:hypothetical protein
MPDTNAVAATLIGAFDHAHFGSTPYRHWLPEGLLPAGALDDIDALPVAPPSIDDTLGKRETHNASRLFFGVEERGKHPVCDALASALQSDAVVSRLERMCDVNLRDSHLRIEYCLDTDGFWLEPHTDIGAKLFTMLIYLSSEPGSEAWGTDILDKDFNLVLTSPYRRNLGLIFIPGANTWHGFHKRLIVGVRRSLIVNYVKPEWRSRHELAFPDRRAGT